MGNEGAAHCVSATRELAAAVQGDSESGKGESESAATGVGDQASFVVDVNAGAFEGQPGG